MRVGCGFIYLASIFADDSKKEQAGLGDAQAHQGIGGTLGTFAGRHGDGINLDHVSICIPCGTCARRSSRYVGVKAM